MHKNINNTTQIQLYNLPDEILIQIILYSNNLSILLTNKFFYRFIKLNIIKASYLLNKFGQNEIFCEKLINHPWFNFELVFILLKFGAIVSNEDYFIIRWGCQNGYVDFIKRIFTEQKAYQVDINYLDGLFLGVALENDNEDVAKCLIELGLNFKKFINEIFIKLTKTENFKGLDFLLKYGADINYRNGKALRESSYLGNFKVFEYLLRKGANVHVFNETCLLNACHKGNYKCVRLLVEYGADINFNGGSALRIAASHGHFKVVELLINRGINLNSHSSGIKALRDSAQNGHVNIVRLLLNHGVPASGFKDAALYYALLQGHYDVIKALLEAGADLKSLKKESLDYALKNHSKDVIKLLYQFGL